MLIPVVHSAPDSGLSGFIWYRSRVNWSDNRVFNRMKNLSFNETDSSILWSVITYYIFDNSLKLDNSSPKLKVRVGNWCSKTGGLNDSLTWSTLPSRRPEWLKYWITICIFWIHQKLSSSLPWWLVSLMDQVIHARHPFSNYPESGQLSPGSYQQNLIMPPCAKVNRESMICSHHIVQSLRWSTWKIKIRDYLCLPPPVPTQIRPTTTM